MDIIIVGCGRLGSYLANELSDSGHNISVIDSDTNRLNVLGSGFNGQKLKGIEYDGDLLQEAGIANADVLLAVTPDENINITVSLIAKKIYRVPRIIARIVNPNRKYIYDNLEIETINPTHLAADLIKTNLTVNSSETLAVINVDFEIFEYLVSKSKTCSVDEIERKCGCIISLIIKDGVMSLAQKENLVSRNTKIVCTVDKKGKEKLTALI